MFNEEPKKQISEEDIKKLLDHLTLEESIEGSTQCGVENLGNGMFRITAGKRVLITAEDGLQQFHEAMKKEAENFKYKKDGK
jgi:RecB family endonuclease NucS